MKKLIFTLTTLLLIFALTACSAGQAESTGSAADSTSNELTAAVQQASSTQVTSAAAVPAALAENQEPHSDQDDYTWDSTSVIPIQLNGTSVTASHPAVSVDSTTVTITAAGTYSLSGTLADGQIVVNATEDGMVRLILNGVDLHCSTSAPLYILAADKAMLVLAEGTQNTISDGSAYVLADPAANEPNAAVFSMADLTIYGSGSLTVSANYQDGIASKDGLLITSGSLNVTAVDDGIRGKDYLVVEDGLITVQAQGDGLKSDNEADASRGYISIESGKLQITAGGDAIHALTDVMIQGGELTLVSGGGSSSRLAADVSAKGIKGAVSVTIDGGSFSINAADDGIHSNGAVQINGGSFAIASGDDGIHADATLEINGGEINITESYEGLESAVITLNAGTIHVFASDDGINVAGGADGSGNAQGVGPGTRPGKGAVQDAFTTASGSYFLYIHGGYVVVDAYGDGLDVNGSIEMTGGVVLVNGPVENMNGALDYDGTFNLSGGYFLAVGSAGMAMAPSSGSTQVSVLLNFSSYAQAGALLHIENSTGEEIVTYAPTRQYQSILFSSPALEQGETYSLFVGGSSSGTLVDGLYTDGAYSDGSELGSFEITSIITQIGGSGGRTRP